MFAWDEAKDRRTLEKHGIGFEAVERFDWSEAQVREDTRGGYGERRFVATGLIGGRLHVVVYTERIGAYRIISLRKANPRERKRYERQEELH